MADDDDDESETGLYENGRWVWDDKAEQLLFISTSPDQATKAAPVSATLVAPKVPTGTLDFRDDIDVIEQLRFRKRYQRKVPMGEPDIITVQDVKDLALFTAPSGFLTPVLINFLHLATTERFLRALIFYCQYYLQVSDEMTCRAMQLETKIRTPYCYVLETKFRENLNDIRILVAKEYCIMINGAGEYRKFHHMGYHKKRRSLSVKDARIFESFFRMCVQIVWIALGRRSFNQLELEINRIFKSDTFNSVEHLLKTNYLNRMSKEERDVLFGFCVKKDRILKTHSPLVNEIVCGRPVDYRLAGLGVIEPKYLTPRLRHILAVLVSPEEELENMGLVCGIIGKKRAGFDTMLKPIEIPVPAKSDKIDRADPDKVNASRHSTVSARSGMSKGSKRSLKSNEKPPIFDDILLPDHEEDDINNYSIPEEFPDAMIKLQYRSYTKVQRRKWLERLTRQSMMAKRKASK